MASGCTARRARGEEVELPERTVRIDRLELLGFDEAAQEAELEVECSSGTYVRQLVADLGELCGAGAHCTALERTRVGPFELADADPERMLLAVEALAFLPERRAEPRRRPPRCATDASRSPADGARGSRCA